MFGKRKLNVSLKEREIIKDVNNFLESDTYVSHVLKDDPVKVDSTNAINNLYEFLLFDFTLSFDQDRGKKEMISFEGNQIYLEQYMLISKGIIAACILEKFPNTDSTIIEYSAHEIAIESNITFNSFHQVWEYYNNDELLWNMIADILKSTKFWVNHPHFSRAIFGGKEFPMQYCMQVRAFDEKKSDSWEYKGLINFGSEKESVSSHFITQNEELTKEIASLYHHVRFYQGCWVDYVLASENTLPIRPRKCYSFRFPDMAKENGLAKRRVRPVK